MRVQFLGGKDPLEWKWQSTPLFLPGKSHGRRSLVGYSPWGHKRQKQLSITSNKQTHMPQCMQNGVLPDSYYTGT